MELQLHPENKPFPDGLPANVNPHTYFKELAEMGALYEFLTSVMKNQFRADQRFRLNMLSLLVTYPTAQTDAVNRELLMELADSLTYFINKANQSTWNNQP
ncbi:MAG: hypothetical protein JNJ85_03125 [Candidatus Kapabacteria bacterium]|nr:hypothetical protein [Candidatus Kapabacteria bacterium]MBX7156499.1 hypothetical protein [Bacteroidota bacterium]